ncbi:hypothetical protein BDV25DRAFT_131380 [Aspergillus avenaceus]|uniref:Nuclear transport factor 2 n=1 Tax=Aspergillus avenaceus TaxID=36643 RepID=A0A5N6TPM9_ASPAV|nr:hypothetical protein BDV25DRAFT_131380 [Aspergillus avenaceus]
MDFQAIANAFTSHYYRIFENPEARLSLSSLYRPESMLVWEGSQYKGTENILVALNKTELKTVKTHVSSKDATPSVEGGVLVSTTSDLVVMLANEHDKPMKFSMTFLLQPIPGQSGGYFIYSQIFRLVI